MGKRVESAEMEYAENQFTPQPRLRAASWATFSRGGPSISAFRLIAMPLAVALLCSTAFGAVAPSSTPTTTVTGTPQLTIETAAILAGKLVITGTAGAPGAVVRLRGTTFTARADA
ncbi:MAG: hypothetical protein H0T75_17530, partial [Rhizobiales bacterium]|nr:hypothetical protein [Hyphomicrobiales bacterium]